METNRAENNNDDALSRHNSGILPANDVVIMIPSAQVPPKQISTNDTYEVVIPPYLPLDDPTTSNRVLTEV